MKEYKLFQVAMDGEHVIDSKHGSLSSAQNTSANMGSKWFFYPLSVIVSGKSIVETGGNVCYVATGEPVLSSIFKRRRLSTLCKVLKSYSEDPNMKDATWEDVENQIIADYELNKKPRK